tara:strand:- start:168 stop:449 length:282 start_codon:yes stop_codon:yes gene_type:complete
VILNNFLFRKVDFHELNILTEVVLNVGDYFVEVNVILYLVKEFTSGVDELIIFEGSQLGLENWFSRDSTSWLEVDSVHKKIELITGSIISGSG